METVEFLKRKTLREHEQFVATTLTTSANYLAAHFYNGSVGTKYFDEAAINGAIAVDDAIEAVALITGEDPSNMVAIMPPDTWSNMKFDSNFKPNTESANPAKKSDVTEMFGLREIMIARSVYSPTKKGKAVTPTHLWLTNSLIIAVVPSSPSLSTPATGYTFAWNGQEGAKDGQVVTKWRDPMNRGGGGEYTEFGFFHDPKVTGVNTAGKIQTAYLFQNVYTP